MNNAVAQFHIVFNNSVTETPYRAEWENGTGYLNGLMRDISLIDNLEQGKIVKSVRPEGGRILMTKTRVGMVVAFERTQGGTTFIAHNIPLSLKLYLDLDNGPLNEKDFLDLFGETSSVLRDFDFFLKKLRDDRSLLESERLKTMKVTVVN